GIVRTLVFEATGASEEAVEAVRYLVGGAVATVLGYVVDQMAAGRLRTMNPLLAVQLLVGPILLHLITRGVAERAIGFSVPLEDGAVELAERWLRAMRRDEDDH